MRRTLSADPYEAIAAATDDHEIFNYVRPCQFGGVGGAPRFWFERRTSSDVTLSLFLPPREDL